MPVPRRDRRWIWAGRIAAVLVLAGLTVYLARVGLDTADKLASSIGVVIAVAALLAPYLLPAQQPVPTPDSAAPAPSQAVTGSGVGGDVRQISGVAGGVRIGPPPTTTGQPPAAPVPPPPPAAVPDAAPAAPPSQVVDKSTVTGSVTQIGTVGGDVDIDR